jgi:hypothetical protein
MTNTEVLQALRNPFDPVQIAGTARLPSSHQHLTPMLHRKN